MNDVFPLPKQCEIGGISMALTQLGFLALAQIEFLSLTEVHFLTLAELKFLPVHWLVVFTVVQGGTVQALTKLILLVLLPLPLALPPSHIIDLFLIPHGPGETWDVSIGAHWSVNERRHSRRDDRGAVSGQDWRSMDS